MMKTCKGEVGRVNLIIYVYREADLLAIAAGGATPGTNETPPTNPALKEPTPPTGKKGKKGRKKDQ